MTVRRLSIEANDHGGDQRPTLQVIHDIECPLREGYAESTARMFARVTGKSAHKVVGPEVVVECLPLTIIAWHVGPNGNRASIGYEQCGYARFTRAEWLTGAGAAQLDNLAAELAADGLKWGIPDRHLTDDELRRWAANGRRAVDGGRVTHDQIRRVLGGTTHTDPMPSYPLDVLNARVTAHRNGGADDMPDPADLWNYGITNPASGARMTAAQRLLDVETQVTTLRQEVGKLGYLLMYGDDANTAKDKGTHPNNLQEIRIELAKDRATAAAQAAAYLEALKGVASGGPVDLAAVEAAAQRGAADALSRVELIVAPEAPPAETPAA